MPDQANEQPNGDFESDSQTVKQIAEFMLTSLLRMLALQRLLMKKNLITPEELKSTVKILNESDAMKKLRNDLGIRSQYLASILEEFEGPPQ